jgi:hypothetical protein
MGTTRTRKGTKPSKTRRSRDTHVDPDADVPVVGGREPCPCGSNKRYKACHGRSARQRSTQLVSRPFEGLTGEGDWVALRQIVPAATATARTTADHGAREVLVASVLPLAWPAVCWADGTTAIGLQTMTASGDPSRDVAAALLQALGAEPGTPVLRPTGNHTGPRLQDLLDPAVPFEVTVHEGFDFWLRDAPGDDPQISQSLERANAAATPTARLSSVEAAYWCKVGERCYLRWVLPHPEDFLMDALARLHARDGLRLLPDSRFAGSFRTDGLLAPVWDLPEGCEPAALEEPTADLAARLAEVLLDAPLTPEERRSRAGVASRQLTLR